MESIPRFLGTGSRLFLANKGYKDKVNKLQKEIQQIKILFGKKEMTKNENKNQEFTT
jgi:hypothetical protein